jgi:hypothetical protein
MEWRKNQSIRLAILALLFSSMSIWIREAEPFWIVTPLLLIFFAQQKRLILTLLAVITVLAFSVPWSQYHSHVLSSFEFVSSSVSLTTGLNTLSFQHFLNFFLFISKNFIIPYLPLHSVVLLIATYSERMVELLI